MSAWSLPRLLSRRGHRLGNCTKTPSYKFHKSNFDARVTYQDLPVQSSPAPRNHKTKKPLHKLLLFTSSMPSYILA
jgi:hypothetical protein